MEEGSCCRPGELVNRTHIIAHKNTHGRTRLPYDAFRPVLLQGRETPVTVLALILILVAAVFHATWNLLAKQAERTGGGAAFVWLSGVCGAFVYLPAAVYIALFVLDDFTVSWKAVLAVLGSSLLHLAYYLTLQKGYRVGDLSVVYPVARGTAPLITTAGAIALFGERPSAAALLGGMLVSISIFLLAEGSSREVSAASSRSGVRYGLVIAVLIASYTLWDKYAVSMWLLSPVLLDWGSNVLRTILLLPYVLPRWSQVRTEWRENGRRALLVGFLSSLAYILVLQALSFTPASYIAPAREVSILVGAVMGARVLREHVTWRRLTGACCMVIALIALALG